MANLIFDFLRELIGLLKVQISKDPNPQVEDTLDAYKWLLEQTKIERNKRVALHKSPVMHNGKIYVFKYLAKTADKLAYWDRHPIMLFLGYQQGKEGKLMVGLNISWYPPDARKYIIEKIRTLYKDKYELAMKLNPNDAVGQRPVLLDLYTLKSALDLMGLSFAIRTYLPSQMLQPVLCINYEDWDKAVRLDTPRIFPELQTKGPQIMDIYKAFRDYVKNYQDNLAKNKIIRDKNKKLKKYEFIK